MERVELPVERLELNAEQRAAFERVGVLRLPAFFPNDVIAPMADALWADLGRRFAMHRDSPDTWTSKQPAQFQALIRSGAFDALAPRVGAVADLLLGSGEWQVPKHWGQPLVTFPTGAWDVPHTMWHLDVPATECVTALPVIRVFTFLEPVLPHGGGTCYVAGSHRVAIDRAVGAAPGKRLGSADVKAVLRREEPWFAALFSRDTHERERRFMTDGGVARGIEVRVQEMTGAPGDAYVMHPAMLHSIASNGLPRPRLMLVQALYRRGAYGAMQ